MRLAIRQMSQAEAAAIAGWRYDGAYAFCNSDADAEDLALLLSGEVRANTTIELGLGLRPDRTGHGSGLAFVEAGMAFARDRFRPERFRLAVATFHERARTVYERAASRPCVRTTTRQQGASTASWRCSARRMTSALCSGLGVRRG